MAVSLGKIWLAAGLLIGLSGCGVQDATTQKALRVSTQPISDKRLTDEDFAFPSQPPSLVQGQQVYQSSCVRCHAVSFWQQKPVQDALTFTTPIDGYLYLTTGKAPQVQFPSEERRQALPALHPGRAFRTLLSRDDRWAALFYVRYLAGAGDIHYTAKDGKPLDVASIYGGNCAVCHGKRGFADGPLHSGHASSHELASAKVTTGLFQPPPANFHDYKRLYNRTDAQMYRYIVQGIYPSGMPPWLGRVDKDYHFAWDDALIWMLVRHERSFAYKNDLPEDSKPPAGAIPDYRVSPRYEALGSNFEQVRHLEKGLPLLPKAVDTHGENKG